MRRRRQQLVVVGSALLGGLVFGTASASTDGRDASEPAAPATTEAAHVRARAASDPVLAILDPTTTATTEAPTTTTTDAPTTTTTAAPTTTTTAPPPPPPPPSSSAEAAIRHWFGDVYDKAYDVAMCESGMDPGAVSAGGGNHGLFQINNVHRESFADVTGVAFEDGVYDADLNSQFARWLYDQQGWSPWACA